MAKASATTSNIGIT